MLKQPLDRILFLDVETVPQVESYQLLPSEMQHLWDYKVEKLSAYASSKFPTGVDPQDVWDQAAIYAEFGRIVCISIGICYTKNGERYLKTKSFYTGDERKILTDFFAILTANPNYLLCGHNIKEFDVPFICRRALINSLELPYCLQIAGKKPWEVPFLDTMELWKFGDVKNYTPLKMLTAIFDIPSSKDDIDGSEVARVYYKEKNIRRISTYCQKDVIATAQVFLRMNGEETIQPDNISMAD